jgi:hypothetical protein
MQVTSRKMDWKSFTEFFEGDGAVSVRLGRAINSKVLQICVVIGQKWRPKLDQIDRFLREAGIDSAKIYPQKYGYTLRVFRIAAVKEILANILPYAFLKREQIRAALDYLNGKISGDRLVAIYNREYQLGKRRSKAPSVSVPFKKLGVRSKRRNQVDLTRSTRPSSNAQRSQVTRRGRTRFPVPSSSS